MCEPAASNASLPLPSFMLALSLSLPPSSLRVNLLFDGVALDTRNVSCHFVSCRNDGDLELLDPEGHSPEMLKCVWEDAITDIAVVR